MDMFVLPTAPQQMMKSEPLDPVASPSAMSRIYFGSVEVGVEKTDILLPASVTHRIFQSLPKRSLHRARRGHAVTRRQETAHQHVLSSQDGSSLLIALNPESHEEIMQVPGSFLNPYTLNPIDTRTPTRCYLVLFLNTKQ